MNFKLIDIIHQYFTQNDQELVEWLNNRFVETSPDVDVIETSENMVEDAWLHQQYAVNQSGSNQCVNVMYAKPNNTKTKIGLIDETHHLSDGRMFRLVEYKPNTFFVFIEPKSNFYLIRKRDVIAVENTLFDSTTGIQSVTQDELVIFTPEYVELRFRRADGEGIGTALKHQYRLIDNPDYVKIKQMVHLIPSESPHPSTSDIILDELMNLVDRRM